MILILLHYLAPQISSFVLLIFPIFSEIQFYFKIIIYSMFLCFSIFALPSFLFQDLKICRRKIAYWGDEKYYVLDWHFLVYFSWFCFLFFFFLIWNASRICMSSLCRGHANLLCIVPILVYVLPKRALDFVFCCNDFELHNAEKYFPPLSQYSWNLNFVLQTVLIT